MARKKHRQEVEAQVEERAPEAREEKRPVAYVYTGHPNRYEFTATVNGEERVIVLWRNMVYRNLPDCKEVRALIEKGDLKPIY